MTWYNPKTWFARPQGVFVKVLLDYGFGEVEAAKPDARPKFKIEPTRSACLYIPDLTQGEAQKALAGRSFDWHRIHSHWRHYLELEGFHSAPWADVQKYLKEE